jgi:hypothetical protein
MHGCRRSNHPVLGLATFSDTVIYNTRITTRKHIHMCDSGAICDRRLTGTAHQGVPGTHLYCMRHEQMMRDRTLPTPMSAETRPPELIGSDQVRVVGSHVRLTGKRFDTITRCCCGGCGGRCSLLAGSIAGSSCATTGGTCGVSRGGSAEPLGVSRPVSLL